MLDLTEEPYDSEVAQRLVLAMVAEVEQRYAAEIAEMTEEEAEADMAAYVAEVTPALTTRPAGSFVVARLDGEPVGCGALKPLHGKAGVGEIKRMYTAPGARRRGVSRAVLARLEAIAAELGYRSLQLETGTEQPEAVALYESDGWHRIAPYGRYKDTPSSICFAKELPADGPAEAGVARAAAADPHPTP